MLNGRVTSNPRTWRIDGVIVLIVSPVNSE